MRYLEVSEITPRHNVTHVFENDEDNYEIFLDRGFTAYVETEDCEYFFSIDLDGRLSFYQRGLVSTNYRLSELVEGESVLMVGLLSRIVSVTFTQYRKLENKLD